MHLCDVQALCGWMHWTAFLTNISPFWNLTNKANLPILWILPIYEKDTERDMTQDLKIQTSFIP